jgi:hypothetical protein
MLVSDLTMDMIEFSDDASDLEGRQIPQSTASICKATEKVMDYRDGQEVFPDASKTSKVPGATLLNIRPLFIFFDHGRDDAFPVYVHIEIFFGSFDDFRNVQGFFRCGEYVVYDSYLRPASFLPGGWFGFRIVLEEFADNS